MGLSERNYRNYPYATAGHEEFWPCDYLGRLDRRKPSFTKIIDPEKVAEAKKSKVRENTSLYTYHRSLYIATGDESHLYRMLRCVEVEENYEK